MDIRDYRNMKQSIMEITGFFNYIYEADTMYQINH